MDQRADSGNPNKPVQILSIVLELGGLKRGGSPNLRLLYTLSGTAELIINGLRHLELEVGSIYIVNPGEPYEITDMDNFAAVVFSINMEYFCSLLPVLPGTYFSTLASGVEQDDYDALSLLLSQSLKIFSGDNEEGAILQSLIAHRTVLLLLKKFRLKSHGRISNYKGNDDTIQKIMSYIDQNSTEKLTLPLLSEIAHLNSQYLSRLFKRETGMTLIRYINQVRILKSEKDILYSNLCASDIADKYGFANTKSFYKAFRSVFGKTPGEHKADMLREADNHLNFNLRCPSPKLYTKEMVKQFIRTKGEDPAFNIPFQEHNSDWATPNAMDYKIQCPLSAHAGTLPPIWTYSLSSENVMEYYGHTDVMLPVKGSGLLNRWFRLYCEDLDGTPYYNYSECNKLADFFISKGMTLVVSLFFMPMQLSRYPDRPYRWYGGLGPPRDMQKWLEMIGALTRHLIKRYGVDTMRTARFSLWDDPTVNAYWQGTQEEFWEFAAKTCHTIKGIDKQLKVGFPNLQPANITVEWLRSLKDTLDRHETAIDYIGNVLTFLRPEPDAAAGMRFPLESGKGYVLADSSYPQQMAADFKKKLLQCGFHQIKYSITSAIPTGLQDDLVLNTNYMNTFIVKTFFDTVGIASLVNFPVEPVSTFSLPGTQAKNFDFPSMQALYRSRLNVFHLLSKLGTHIIRKGSNYIVTADNGKTSYQVLCYNYCHYRPDVVTPVQITNAKPSETYTFLENGETVHLVITLMGIRGRFYVKRYRLTPQCGCAFDAWIRIGTPKTPSEEDLQYIQSCSNPEQSTSVVHADGTCTLCSSVAPHEIELVEIIKIAGQ